jgi:hypothetical protein
VIGVVADCADPAAVAEIRERIVAELGEPSIVICTDGAGELLAGAFTHALALSATRVQVTTLAVAGGSSHP